MTQADRIPVAVLTGFLGSGKTTVLQHLARRQELGRTLVLVNEFGEVGLDHKLLTPIEDDTLVAIESGCICCTIRADLAQTLSDAPWRYSRDGQRWFDRVVIETTGIADPAPVLQTIIGEDAVAKQYNLAGVLTAVDAVNGRATLEGHLEAAKQVAVADRVLLTKTDLLQSEPTELCDMLASLAPAAPIDTVINGEIDASWLFHNGLYALDGKTPDVAQWLRDEAQAAPHQHHHHNRNRHGQIQASSLVFDSPVDVALFEACLGLLLQHRGPDLLRIKGIVNVQGMDKPMVFHGVQHVFHPPEILDQWPDEDRRTRIVIIARDIDHSELAACFTDFGLPVTSNPVD